MSMNIAADIQWIKEELDQVNDEGLIALVRRLLEARSEVAYREMERMVMEAESAIAENRVISHEELKKEMLGWRKRHDNHLD